MYAENKKNSNVVPFDAASAGDMLPPQAVEVEEAILGGILLDPVAMERIAEILVPEAFYLSAHKEIYLAMRSLHESDKPTDLLTVSQYLHDMGNLAIIGGRNKLASLVDRTVCAVNIDAQAELIMDKYLRRQVISTGNEIVRAGYDKVSPVQEIMQKAESAVFDLSQGQTGDRHKVESAPDMAAKLFAALESGNKVGKKVGWYDLETLTGGLYDECLTVVAGESHMGKSHFLISYSYEVMTVLKKPVLYISPEMSEDQVNIRLLARISGIDASEIVDNPNRHWEPIADAVGQLADLPWKVYAHPSPTVGMISTAIRSAMREFGEPCMVVIDYLQQLPVTRGGNNLAYELGNIARAIRAIAMDYKIPVYLGSQINRDNQNRQDKRPTKHDLRNSGEVLEVCDQLILLHRPSVYSKDSSDKTIELIVEKNRLHKGAGSTATMLCDLSTSRFMNMARGGY
ncbi:MAG: replicative DNA helicase [Patescibacteria group bacterium]|nr:MAG: replicative DNA helicase [Patescibacteria group bacterium]